MLFQIPDSETKYQGIFDAFVMSFIEQGFCSSILFAHQSNVKFWETPF